MNEELRKLRAELGHAQAVRKVFELIADDAYAMTFQTMRQYRQALMLRLASLQFVEPRGEREQAYAPTRS